MKTNVFVFPCGSEIGLEIYRSLQYSTHFDVIGGSSVDDHGQFVYHRYVGGMPTVDDDTFIDAINAVIAQYDISFVFPAHDSVVLKLAQARAAGALRCDVVTSPIATCVIARSKRATYETLQHTVATPKVHPAVEALQPSDFPVFLKPDIGQGSKGSVLCKSVDELRFHLAKDPSLLILEYLEGREYTVDCFSDRRGTLRLASPRTRNRIANGISVNSSSVDSARFVNMAQRISAALAFRGVWFFQVKENRSGELVLLEVAPRVAGTMALTRCLGANLVLLSLFDAMGQEVVIDVNTHNLTVDRALKGSYKHDIAYAHAYLDLDDLVISRGLVNPVMIAFIFQCRNKGVVVHLLTRHSADLTATLERYRLNDVFDDVIVLSGPSDSKYRHIIETNAIFIDDSFSERYEVHKRCGIPTFDAHAIESLMDDNG